MAYGKRSRAAKVGSHKGKGGHGKNTVLSSPYHNVIADLHKRRGGKKR
jgi:hypothetical protein